MGTAIAFLGLGNMGGRMAARLIAAGYRVTVYDPDVNALRRLSELGAEPAGLAEVARGAEFVLSSLPTPEIVEAVYTDRGGVLANAAPGTVAIDFSTIDPGTVRRIAEHAAELSIDFLDAPVSRGVAGAETGTLSIMVGGEQAALDRARPVLDHLGDAIQHVGGSGTGQLVKLCNNMVAAITCVALGEVMVAGLDAGLTTDVMYDVLHSSSADSHLLSAYFPRAVFPPDRPTGFSLDFMVKDVDLFLRAMGGSKVPLLLSGLTKQIYRICQDQDLGRRDSTAVVEFYEKLAGVRLELAGSK